MKHFDLSRFRKSTGVKRYPGLQEVPKDSAGLLDRIESEVQLRKDFFALICRPIRKSEVVDTFFKTIITRALAPELTAVQIENIPDDWVRVLRLPHQQGLSDRHGRHPVRR